MEREKDQFSWYSKNFKAILFNFTLINVLRAEQVQSCVVYYKMA